MYTTYDEKNPKLYIRDVAIEATKLQLIFFNVQGNCDHFRFNQLTKAKNCFHGNTKTKCDLVICPLKGEKIEQT